MSLLPTPSQTAGPFLSMGFAPLERRQLVLPGAEGAVVVEGRLLDGAGMPVPDGVVEVWQADPDGRFTGTGAAAAGGNEWSGFGRSLTDVEGRFDFVTRRPGPVPLSSGVPQAPHLDLLVFARGLTRSLRTRMYFPAEGIEVSDPVLAALPEARRATLLAVAEGGIFRFDIHLQGEDETVFFSR